MTGVSTPRRALAACMLGAVAIVAMFVVLTGGATANHGPKHLCADPDITGGTDKRAIVGTRGDDVIKGSNGPDVIRGRGGNDLICGNRGPDLLKGGPGDDRMHGQHGNDRLRGGRGFDRVYGGASLGDSCGAEREKTCEG